jgi:hypothetical protein
MPGCTGRCCTSSAANRPTGVPVHWPARTSSQREYENRSALADTPVGRSASWLQGQSVPSSRHCSGWFAITVCNASGDHAPERRTSMLFTKLQSEHRVAALCGSVELHHPALACIGHSPSRMPTGYLCRTPSENVITSSDPVFQPLESLEAQGSRPVRRFCNLDRIRRDTNNCAGGKRFRRERAH